MTLILILLSAVFLLSCGPTPHAERLRLGADPGCIAGSAQFSLGDGYIQALCGCNEPGSRIVGSGQGQIVCTVPVGTQVFFYYMATRNTHQLVPASGSSFPPSAISDPAAKAYKVRSHSFKASTPGTYTFFDAFDNGIVGGIVAQ